MEHDYEIAVRHIKMKDRAKYRVSLFILMLVLEFTINPVQAQTKNELIARSGLSNLIQKVNTQDSIRIAYFGGSITEASGWRAHSFDFLTDRFPETHFIQIPASIGGTGSELGAYRLTEHVLIHHPDLVFVEFAVNDNAVADDKIIQAMEGIVLQIKQNSPETDICFIYTIMESFLEKEKFGELPDSKLAMEKVAQHYGIPSINFGFEVSKRVVENTLLFTGKQTYIDAIPVFSADGVHPYFETGHAIYAEIFSSAMDKLLIGSTSAISDLPEPLYPIPLTKTRSVALQQEHLEGPWMSFDPNSRAGFEKFAKYLDKIYVASETSAQLRIEFKGTSIGFMDIVGPEAGTLIIELDGELYSNKIRFDKYSNFRRISYFLIDDLEDKEHQLVIKIDPHKIDKEAILNKRNITVDDPELYKDQTWQLGKILINGELLLGQENDTSYQENYRPQFHFTPPGKWMNDPNGMVYLDGEYHLFYQYNPNSITWGPMHWGHAISEDLVHWRHMPIALYPDENGMIFSGSAVYDEKNTSGLGTAENPPLLAIFTYHDSEAKQSGKQDVQTQGLAYSIDKGRNWIKYKDNPVLPNPGIADFRDPKVIWVNDKWIMSLAVKDRIQFYASPNMIDWTYESDFNPDWAAYEGVWECPDLFPLVSEDGIEKWVLLVSVISGGPQKGSATQYFIGDFDGSTFRPDGEQVRWLDYGSDNYAGVTWSNIPESDGRKILIGWMSNWWYAQKVPTAPWRSAMTLPRELKLVGADQKFALKSSPVEEIKKLRKSSVKVSSPEFELEGSLVELEIIPENEDFTIIFSNNIGEMITLQKSGNDLYFDRSQSGQVDFQKGFGTQHHVVLEDLKIDSLRIYLDTSSIEIFINDGQLTLTNLLFPNESYNRVSLTGFEDESVIHYLSSIWTHVPS